MSDAVRPAERHAMRRALLLAERGADAVSPNPLVGCVLLHGHEQVGEGWHRRVGGPHAEVEALAAAGPRARGATAVVTLEPCSHTGRTPPCTHALVAAGVRRVVAAIRDPHAVAAGGVEQLRRAGVDVEVGCLADEATWVNRVFLHGVAHATPWVVLKAATSLDGRIAAADGTSQWLTTPATRRLAHALRAAADAVLVGSGTVLADDPALTVRLDGFEGRGGRQPLRVVLDRRGRTPPGATVLEDAAGTIIATSRDGGRRLRAAGVDAELLVVPPAVPDESPGREGLDLPAVLDALWQRGVRSVLVEGGGAVLGSLVAARAHQEVVVHVAPLLLGEAGRPLLRGDGIATLAEAPRLELRDVRHGDTDVMLTYAVPEARALRPR